MRVVNFMSAPGAGKTALLESVVRELSGLRFGVLEGDVQGSFDADRLASLHVPVIQLNTASGFGGECHLDANMVRSAIPALPLQEIDLLIVENVGNLVCPAEFRIGEDVRGHGHLGDRRRGQAAEVPADVQGLRARRSINKIDLLPHLELDLDLLLYNIDKVNPAAERILDQRADRRGSDRVRRVAAEDRRRDRSGRVSEAAIEAAARGPAARPQIEGLLDARTLAGSGSSLSRPTAGAAMPPDGRAVRSRRPVGRARRDAGGALRRAPRRGRVRAPGDRRQAGAAGVRAAAAGPELADAGSTCW